MCEALSGKACCCSDKAACLRSSPCAWWSREKGGSWQQRQQQQVLLSQAAQRWGRKVHHVFERGYGTGPWLWQLCRYQLRFVVRWKKGNKLIDACGQERKAWEMARGKRPWGEAKWLWDTHFRLYRSTRVLALPVRHPQYRGQLWLVVVRQGKGREPWYLLTNEPVETAEQVWDIVLSSVRSLQIEERFRFQKTELQIESLRLQGWQARRNMLLLVTLAYGFLLALLSAPLWPARCRWLHEWCQRADWRKCPAKVPISRLRWALASALANASSTLLGLAPLSPALSHHLARLLFPLVDHSLAPVWIFVLTLCSGSCFVLLWFKGLHQ